MTHPSPNESFPDDFLTDAYRSGPPPDDLGDVDSTFVFDFAEYDEPDDESQRWSTWLDVEPLSRGPEPRPDWLVTSQGAIDTELGILKTGKEADVFLVERADPLEPERAVVMAAKRYRSTEHRTFNRVRVLHRGPQHEALARPARAQAQEHLRQAGRRRASGPSPSGTPSSAGGCSACRSPTRSRSTARRSSWSGSPSPIPTPATTRSPRRLGWPRRGPTRQLLASYFDQLRDVLATTVQAGIVHGDLSPYNILAAGERLVIIDLPQVVDLVGNANGMDYLMRDCANVCRWFRARGLDVDEQELFGELMAHAF